MNSKNTTAIRFRKPKSLSEYLYIWRAMDDIVMLTKRGKAAIGAWKRGSVPHVNMGTAKMPVFTPVFANIAAKGGKSVYRALRYADIDWDHGSFSEEFAVDMKHYGRLYALFAEVMAMD